MSSDKHLTSGSAYPPFPAGKVRIYAMRFSPFVHRLLLVCERKEISYEIVYINLKDKPEWFKKFSPFGTVPAVEFEDGKFLYDSKVIADYFDEIYPKNKLYPADPFYKAKTHLQSSSLDEVTKLFFKLYYDGDYKVFEKILSYFDYFHSEYKKYGKSFFGGDKPGMVDYYFWPIFERLEVVKIIKGDKYVFPTDRYSYLFKWAAFMKEEYAVKKYYLDSETHAKFIKSEIAGKPDFDFLFN